MFAQLELVNAFDQHCQPIGAAERCDEGVEAALRHLFAQQSGGKVAYGRDRQLGKAAVELLLNEAAKAVGCGG